SVDAELVALGIDLERCYLEIYPMEDEDKRLGWECFDKAFGALGMRPGHRATHAQTEKFFEMLGNFEEELGRNALDDSIESLRFDMELRIERILELDAHSLAGLRSKVLASVYCNEQLFCTPLEKLALNERVLAQLINSVAKQVGLDEFLKGI